MFIMEVGSQVVMPFMLKTGWKCAKWFFFWCLFKSALMQSKHCEVMEHHDEFSDMEYSLNNFNVFGLWP